MPAVIQDFALPTGLTAAQFASALAERLPLSTDAGHGLERTYLDTFDWRLHRAGGLLLAKRTPDDRYSLLWEGAGNGKPLASVRAKAVPVWPADLPSGHLRDQLAKAAAMRALLPLVSLRSEVHLLRVLNEDRKTVLRMRLETPRCIAPRGRAQTALTPRLTLVPVKGYEKEAAAVGRLLVDQLGLRPPARALGEEALAAVGRQPGDYSSKLTVELQAHMPAGEAVRRILRHLLNTLEANVGGARADLDSEFLHDLRVATRRTRAALSQVKGVLPAEVVADFAGRFAWLGRVTGPARDLDVFVLGFPGYRRSLPAALRADLDPLLPYLKTQQRAAQQALRRRLDAPHFRRLLKDWRDYLEGAAVDPAAAPNAATPIGELAGARLWRMYRRVLREGRAIDAATPAAELHQLRKSCKKLRYLLEFFASLYPAEHITPLTKQLKRLLDKLGDFQDLQVQAERLRVFGSDLQQQGERNLPVVLAIGTLIGDLLRRQAAARAAFAGRFAAFDDRVQHARCRAMFKQGELPG